MSETSTVFPKAFKVYQAVVERPLFLIGLMQSPLKRFSFFTIATAVTLATLQPKALFEDSKSRPWIINSKLDGATLNWVLLSLFAGFLSVWVI